MHSSLLRALLLILFGVTPATAGWNMSEFMIYLWGSPEVSDVDAKARALKDAGFTVVDWDVEHLDALQRYGLQAMIHNTTAAEATQLAGHPAVWGYHCGDEPYPESEFAPLAARIKTLRRADPHHPSFVNLLSTTGEFLRTYMKTVQPEIVSFDYYQWWWGSDRYFEKLEQFHEAAALARVPLGSCFEVSANPGVERGDKRYLPDNLSRLRQSVYTSLAYGVKAVEWFSSDLLFEPGKLELTSAGKDVAVINAEVRHLGQVLVKLHSVDVYHTLPLAAGTATAPKEHWVHVVGEEAKAGLVLGMFEDSAGTDYLMVANRDLQDPQSVVVRLQSKWLGIAPWHKPKKYNYAIDSFNKQTGAWESVTSSSFVGFTFLIGAADGELFRVKTTVKE